MAPQPEDPDEPNRMPVLVGFLVIVALVVVAYWVVTALRHEGQMEDCLMSSRTNCAPIEAPSTGR
jgi:hypothetical protein